VGIIDVSTLGKFLVTGPDAAAFLDRLYPSRIADQPVGRIRYGLMLNEEGVVVDDGAVARLAEDVFYVTATTGNAAAIDRWMSSWQAVWDLRVDVWNVTGGYAAINVAGPRAREVLAPLVDRGVLDGLQHLGACRARVAGTEALLLRLGFVGEVAYEVHVPSGAAQHVWEALLTRGAAAGIVPFGLEAQRILRLEKGHILIGQDTDAETDPFGCGLSRLVHLDKGEFLGRDALQRRAAEPPRQRLVGFVVDDGAAPAEGSAVVEDGRPAGRVTSCRWSPTLGRVIGLAWVRAERATPGTAIAIRAGDEDVGARVASTPFYDPEGRRLRG
jgi:sarcosine oxidase subunit alpha